MIYKVIWAMLLLLSEEIPLEKLLTKQSICKIKPIAGSITYSAQYPTWYDMELVQTLIAVAYVESRFTYTKERGEVIVSPKGACGLFQAIPKYTEYKCHEFADHLIAGMVAVDHIRMIENTWGLEDEHLCHYNSGNRCNKESRSYANTVIEKKKQIEEIFKSDFFTLETIAISLMYSQCPKENLFHFINTSSNSYMVGN